MKKKSKRVSPPRIPARQPRELPAPKPVDTEVVSGIPGSAVSRPGRKARIVRQSLFELLARLILKVAYWADFDELSGLASALVEPFIES